MLQLLLRKGNPYEHFYREELQRNFVENKSINKLETEALGIHVMG